MSDQVAQQSHLVRALTSKAGLGGWLLFGFAAVVFTEVSHLSIGTAGAMGPGYFPLVLGLLLVAFGAALFVEALRNPDDRVDAGLARPFICLMGGIILFALITPYVGAVISIALLITIVCLAENGASRLRSG